MTFTPYPFQSADLKQLRENNYTALLAIEVGGGKTNLACMAVADFDPDVVLIVAPQSTFRNPERNWPSTMREVAGRDVLPMGNGKKVERENLTAFELGVRGVYACTPQFFTRADTSLWSGDLVIIDEAHKLATAASAGQRALGGYTPKDPEPLSRRFAHRLALSGTPMRQNFSNMWGIMRFLWPDQDEWGQVAYDNFVMWQIERMSWHYQWTNRKDKRTGEPIKVRSFDRESEPGRLVSEMPCVVIHKRREKCCTFHPKGFLPLKEPQVIKRKIDLHPKQLKAIHEMEDHMMTFLNDNPLVADIPLVAKQRIRQFCLGVPTVTYETVVAYNEVTKKDEEKEVVHVTFDPDCESPTIDALLNVLEELDEEPLVVYTDSQKFAEVAVSRLTRAGYSAQEYSGKRKADLEGFGQDYRVLVGVTSSIGEGTNGLQHICQNEAWLDVPVSLTMQTQTQARLDRLGTPQRVTRFQIEDSDGYMAGRLSDLLEKRMHVNASMSRKGL